MSPDERQPDQNDTASARTSSLFFAEVTVLSPLEELGRVYDNRIKGLRGVGSEEREAQLTRAHAIAQAQLEHALTGDSGPLTDAGDVDHPPGLES